LEDRYPAAENAYRALLEYQSGPYRAHEAWSVAIGPYIRRGAVDSTFYSHQSILKTIELILGLPTLSLFDMIANDMQASFQNTPVFDPYEHVTPKQSLFEANPPLAALRGPARKDALDSMRMRWDIPDAAPTERLNRILWRQVRGPRTTIAVGFSITYPLGLRSPVRFEFLL
jgi:hypothetical protein